MNTYREVETVHRPFYEALDASARSALVAAGRLRRHPAHSILFFEADEASHVIVVRSGALKLSLSVDGREVVLDIVGPGDLIGELSVIDGRPRSASATALTPVEVLIVPAPAFRTLIADHACASRALLSSLTARLRGASRRQVEYGALDSVGRVCRRLVEMMARYGNDHEAGVMIDAPLTQSDIAAWAGLSREAVVKALHALRSLGWIITTPRTITVVDVGAVTARASVRPG